MTADERFIDQVTNGGDAAGDAEAPGSEPVGRGALTDVGGDACTWGETVSGNRNRIRVRLALERLAEGDRRLA